MRKSYIELYKKKIFVKKDTSYRESIWLYKDYVYSCIYNYLDKKIEYYNISSFDIHHVEWFVEGNPYLQTNSIFDLAISLIEKNSNWVFIHEEQTEDSTNDIVIKEGRHRMTALQWMASHELIGWDTKVLSFDFFKNNYTFLWKDYLLDYFTIDFLHNEEEVLLHNNKYNSMKNQSADLLGLLYHRLTYANGKLPFDFAGQFSKSGYQIIDFNFKKSQEEIIKTIQLMKQKAFDEATTWNEKGWSLQQKQKIYQDYKDFILASPLEFHSPHDLQVIPGLYKEEFKKFTRLSNKQKKEMIDIIIKQNYPFVVELWSTTVVASYSAILVWLTREAIKEGWISQDTQLMCIKSNGLDVPDFKCPGVIPPDMYITNYLSLHKKISFIKYNHNTYSVFSNKLYGIMLYKTQDILSYQDWLYESSSPNFLKVVQQHE